MSDAPAIVPQRKKFFAVGCSHGEHLDPNAELAVLEAKRRWNPDVTIHLGDFWDTAAFRAGAKGTEDESAPIGVDLQAGYSFLEKLQPQIVFCGNHEDRLYRLRNSSNAIVAHCAGGILDDLEAFCQKIRADLVPYDYKACRVLGNYKFMHGTIYNENAARDMAEAYGNVIFAHTHKAMLSKGRRCDNPTGICVGTLTHIPNMDYAKNRRATLAWSGGFCWGVYSDDRTTAWVHEQPQDQTEWILPL